MEYEFTPERGKYIDSRGRIILNACPGSGKTTSIAKKIGILQENWKTTNNNYSGIACLSFTNKAKDEIQNKCIEVNGKYINYPHLVSTIDSFICKYITLPFFNLVLTDAPSNFKVVDDDSLIENSFKIHYFDRAGNSKEGIERPLNSFKSDQGRLLFHLYNIKDIWIEKNGKFSFKGKSKDSDETFQDFAKIVFSKKLKKGLITSQDASYIALKILSKNNRVGEYLVKRFPYIFIDEAQDCSELQHAVFDKLVEYGLKNIELIGDPYQSLYQWRNAKPQLFIDKCQNKHWQELPMSENRRSNQRIIDFYSQLRQKESVAITSKNVVDRDLPIIIYRYNDENKETIINDFESICISKKLQKNQIVVRGNVLKNRMIGRAIPIEPWKSNLPNSLIKALNNKDIGDLKNAMKELRSVSVDLLFGSIYSDEKKEFESKIKNDIDHNSILYDLLKQIPSLNLSFEEWTRQCQALLKKHFALEVEPNFEFKSRMNGFKMKDLKGESIDLYFKKNISGKYNIPITTIHNIKGATLDSILIFLSESSAGQGVSFNNFVQPTDFPSEKHRILYVACSRPKQFLALAIPDKIGIGEIIAKFGESVTVK